jgi:tetratricopeptide (TPR) repeat protein
MFNQAKLVASRLGKVVGKAVGGIWTGILTMFSDSRKLVLDFLVLVSVAAAIFLTFAALTDRTTILESIAVPQSLKDRGYTGEVVAQKLFDDIGLINATSKTRLARTYFNREQPSILDNLQVPAASVSMAQIIATVRRVAQLEDETIGGEITIRDHEPKYRFVIRLDVDRKKDERAARPDDKRKSTIVREHNDLDAVINMAAQAVLEQTDPMVAASYLYNMREWDELERLLDRLVVSRSPKIASRALSLQGKILSENCYLDQALIAHKEALDLLKKSGERSVWLLVNYADTLAKLGRWADAETQYREAHTLYKGSALPLIGWAKMLNERNQRSEALGKIEAALEIDKDVKDPRIWIAWGDILLEEDPQEAIAKYKRALEFGSRERAWGYNAWGLALYRLGDLNGAVEKFLHAAAVFHGEPVFHLNRGKALLSRNDLDGAMAAIKEAVKLDSDHAPTLRLMSEAYFKAKEWVLAWEMAERARTLKPRSCPFSADYGIAARTDW